ncbi:MAG: alpha-N-arabinofuranosidase [Lachnospiraceae bacterium]|nr:alpha-N-arabinofuranosidase [Lachnospiraceae bacterium]
MKKAVLFSDCHFPLGKVDDKMFSSFTEHLGRCIYTGLYEPGHPTADEDGFRMDVMDLIKELNVPVIRYPGGNFVSCYDWHDGIGPKENRPKRMEYAWSSIETNEFGIDEFCRWAKKAGVEPMIAVNLGTGSIKDAGDLVEYCNHPGGTYWSDLRIKNGSKEPYNIKYWCLGNEMEGAWQAGHLSAEDYAKKALEAAKIMRWVDPSIKLVACGSSYDNLPTYLEWDRIMMKELYDQVDYLSTHNYTMRAGQSVKDYLSSYVQLDNHIKNSVKVLDYVKAVNRKKKDIKICLDEWNVWNFQDIKLDSLGDLNGLTTFEITSADKWEIAPPILQEKYSLLDALVVGGLGISLLNNCDTVEIACLAQLVNVIAPITTVKGGGVYKQTTFYPYEFISRYGRGTVLKSVMDSDTYSSVYGECNTVASSVIYDEKTGEIHIFALNTDENDDVELKLDLPQFADKKVSKHIVLCGDDLDAINTIDTPDNVTPKEITPSGSAAAVLPKLSFNVLILK